ncbi:hypothetical protein ACWGR4_33585 [Embleya sp. NPDC055664]
MPRIGPDTATFRRLFPDGTAFLWGATPTLEKNNAKAIALRTRGPGDPALFRTRRGSWP